MNVDANVVMDKAGLETAPPEAGSQEAIESDLNRRRGGDDWACLVDTNLAGRDGAACDTFADMSASENMRCHEWKDQANKRGSIRPNTYLTCVPKMTAFGLLRSCVLHILP